ncbi:hypothetical protein [Parathalassolituus penaei]|uniref:Uncharacterized protein n=1 Tax=Parathalassolituus penaei TaxID=2997323 RepID=A0A9X3EBH2_9GAMM|nr:hypothetical protein [Parathalassolituus penaei]MCY0963784.1 hypothetical protein [Parathalassolituus penaei]
MPVRLPYRLLLPLLGAATNSYSLSGMINSDLSYNNLPVYAAGQPLEMSGIGKGVRVSTRFLSNWSAGVGVSRLKATDDHNTDNAEYEYQDKSAFVGYQWHDHWFELSGGLVTDHLDAPLASQANMRVNSQTDGERLAFTWGYDWYFGNWSPEISSSIRLNHITFQEDQHTPGAREFQRLNEDHSSTTLQQAASLGYMASWGEQILVSTIGLDYQHSLTGKIEYTGYNNDPASSEQSSGDVQQSSVFVALSWLTDPWSINTSLSRALMNCPCEQQIRITGGYSF